MELYRSQNNHNDPMGRAMDVPPRTVIIDEGDPARSVYKIQAGQVMLSRLLPDGRRQIFELLGPGSIFGVTPNQRHDSVAESLTDTKLSIFERSWLNHIPTIETSLVHCLEAQICALHDHAVLLGRKTATERVSTYILNLVNGQGEKSEQAQSHVFVIVPMTRSEIADYLGLTLETVSRAFSRLKRLGVISYERHDGPMRVAIHRLGPMTGTYWTL